MKKLLMLGASEAQVIAIQRAKAMGLFVITADDRLSNPGHAFADKVFNFSTTDLERILEVAHAERINGIISYASDPGAITAAYVAKNLNLSGDDFWPVFTAQDKLLFREVQKRLKHPHPEFVDSDDAKSLKLLWANSHDGLVVKPTDRCGSAGLHIFNYKPGWRELNDAISFAKYESKKKKVIVERYLQRVGMQFGGDYIFHDGGLMYASYADQYQYRTESTEAGVGNLVPSAQSDYVLESATQQVKELVQALGLKSGIYNTDMIVCEGQVNLLDFGARLGGNMLGEVHHNATGVDYTRAAIEISLGEKPKVEAWPNLSNAGHLVIHSNKSGILSKIQLSPSLQEHLVIELRSKKIGDSVDPYRSTRDRIGILVVKSDDRATLLNFYRNPTEHFGIQVD